MPQAMKLPALFHDDWATSWSIDWILAEAQGRLRARAHEFRAGVLLPFCQHYDLGYDVTTELGLPRLYTRGLHEVFGRKSADLTRFPRAEEILMVLEQPGLQGHRFCYYVEPIPLSRPPRRSK